MGKREDINLIMGHDEEIIMALAMIRHMYHKGEISEIVYKNIVTIHGVGKLITENYAICRI